MNTAKPDYLYYYSLLLGGVADATAQIRLA